MNDNWENDALWNLLGKARPAVASPYFARRVRNAIRDVRRPGFPPILLRWLAAGSLAVLTAGFFWNVGRTAPHQGIAQRSEFTQAFDQAAGIDSLVAAGEFSISDYSNGL